MLKFISGGSQPRSRRIPKADWESHKEDIIREYMSNDMSHTIEWMAKRHNFHASLVSPSSHLFQVADHFSAKQFQHQLKKWNVKKYQKNDQSSSDSGKASSSKVLGRELREEAQQVYDSSPSSVEPVEDRHSSDDAHAEAALGPSSGTLDTDRFTKLTNGSGKESLSGHMSAGPPAARASRENSIDKETPVHTGEDSPNCVGATEPHPSKGIIPEAHTASLPSDPTLGGGPESPDTRSFIEFAQRLSQLEGDAARGGPRSIQTKKSRRASWHQPRADEVLSDDSSSDAMSFLGLNWIMGDIGPSRVVDELDTLTVRRDWRTQLFSRIRRLYSIAEEGSEDRGAVAPKTASARLRTHARHLIRSLPSLPRGVTSSGFGQKSGRAEGDSR
jgi:hypothetical protein